MALFTDGAVVDIERLRQYESSVLEIANTENIDLINKIDLAQAEVASELTRFLVRQGFLRDRDRSLHPVVLTDPLTQWLCRHTLANFYRDAYNSQLNDRYLGKWREYARLSQEAADRFFEIGVGVAFNAMSKPEPPACSLLQGGAIGPATVYVSAASITATGERTALSPAIELAVPAGSAIQVTSADDDSFAVYAGVLAHEMTRQSPVLSAGATFTVQNLSTDLADIREITPQMFVTHRRDLWRG